MIIDKFVFQGNIGAAYSIYDNAIQMLKDKEDLHVFCLLHLHFARFAYLVGTLVQFERNYLLTLYTCTLLKCL